MLIKKYNARQEDRLLVQRKAYEKGARYTVFDKRVIAGFNQAPDTTGYLFTDLESAKACALMKGPFYFVWQLDKQGYRRFATCPGVSRVRGVTVAVETADAPGDKNGCENFKTEGDKDDHADDPGPARDSEG